DGGGGGEEESGERRAEQRRGGEEGCCVRPDTPGPIYCDKSESVPTPRGAPNPPLSPPSPGRGGWGRAPAPVRSLARYTCLATMPPSSADSEQMTSAAALIATP
ncbi:hypothetical protein EG858_15930, partial [Enterococcus faecalis]